MKFKTYILFALILLVVFQSVLNAQTPQEVDTKYYDKYKQFFDDYAGLVGLNAYQSLEEDTAGRFIFKTYNPDKLVMTEKVYCLDKNCLVKSGLQQQWVDDGSLINEGQYYANIKIGKWLESSLYDISTHHRGSYVEGEKQGHWE